MRCTQAWRWAIAVALLAGGARPGRAEEVAIQAFEKTGQVSYNTLANGTNYNYRVEWAPAPGGPWSEFGTAGAFWLNGMPQNSGILATNPVPMCYRVVAYPGDYLVIDISGGPAATSYPVMYCRTLADVPGGADSDVYKTTSLLLRLIPKGTFRMGSPPNETGRVSNETLHPVTLTADFYIGVFEATQRQWELVMGNKPSYFSNPDCYAMRPVEQVNYGDIRGVASDWPASSQVSADSFMGKVRAKTGLATFDLPTEAQWEYACRAGTATALNSGYNLTNAVEDAHMSKVGRYWFSGPNVYGWDNPSVSTNGGTASAGSYAPNAWGLYDMHGNVFEWCLDWYGSYPETAMDPKGPASGGSGRVRRGGGGNMEAQNCRSAEHNGYWEGARFNNYGFRACFTPPRVP